MKITVENATSLQYQEVNMKFKIEVHSQGYEDSFVIVDRPNRNKITKLDILMATNEWIKLNDVDLDSIELPFTRITKL